MNQHWPTEIRLAKDKRTLVVRFEDGATFDLPAEYLRVTSPSAEVQGHAAHERKTIPGKRDVQVIGIDPMGHYAIKLRFDDMHDTGIYTWDYLYELGDKHSEKWSAYLAELSAKGLVREPAGRR